MSSNKEVIFKNDVKDKNVALYMNYAIGSPPLELHYSMIEDLLSRGNKVTVYTCDSGLRSCTANPIKSASVCTYCKFRSSDVVNFFSNKVEVIRLNLDSCSDIVSAEIDESLKLGVMSSMASAVKAQSYSDLNPIWKKNHDNMYLSAKRLFNFFKSEIARCNYDYIFMFNGRFGDVKPVLEATRASNNTGYGLYEVKKSLHDVVFINELIHSIDGNTKRALLSYSKDIKRANEIAKAFFGKKVRQENTGDPVYTQNQNRGDLPEILMESNDKKVVAVYPTTDDEYKFIGKEWDGYVPEDQVREIYNIAKSLPESKYIIVVKMHPNQAHTAENVIDRYLKLSEEFSHVYVEEPLSKKDTYALMYKADFVINFASTIGVEACYARKVVISIGDTTFSKMNTSYKTNSGTEAADLILSGSLKPKSIRGAVIWGNYLSTYSDGLKAFSRFENGDYRVNGEKIGHSKFYRFMQLPAKFLLEINKPGFKFNLAFVNKAVINIKNILKGKWEIK